MIAAEHYLTTKNQLGEGPLWHSGEEALYWVDIERECFFRYIPVIDQIENYPVGQPVGCLAFREVGGLVLALRDGLGLWDWETRQVELISRPEDGRPSARFNDGRVDSRGRLWAGTLGEDAGSSLYRLDPDGSLHVMERGVMISNGLGWSPDDRVMYYTDSPRRLIYAYDFDPESGLIENRREFVRVPPGEGFPDGLAVDSEGFVWSAHWDGWRVTRYDPEGKVDRVVYLPVQRPTSCTFGGLDLDQLFITSAWTGLLDLDRREQPFAGDLFHIYAGVQGKPEFHFGG